MKVRMLFAGWLIPWIVAGSSGPCSAQTSASSKVSDDVDALPLHIVETKTSSPITMALMLTGDGGWASIDRRIAGDFSARGIPVVGLDSRSYLKVERSPEEAARDIALIIRKYTAKWAVQRVAIVGYSRGADMAPFVVNRLPTDLRHEITLIALLGPAERANFQFHWADLLSDHSRPSDRPILPELERLRGTPVLCVYGKDEKESLCRLADTSAVRVNQRSGNHHFDGDYDAIASVILGLIAPVNADGR